MIDLDRGQLEAPELYESLLQPALLVGIPSINWMELSHGNQEGDMRFYTKTAVRLPQHQHFYLDSESDHPHLEELTDENKNALLIEDALHQKIIKIPGVWRENSFFSFSGTFFVVEHRYCQGVHYENVPRYNGWNPVNKIPGINVILNTHGDD